MIQSLLRGAGRGSHVRNLHRGRHEEGVQADRPNTLQLHTGLFMLCRIIPQVPYQGLFLSMKIKKPQDEYLICFCRFDQTLRLTKMSSNVSIGLLYSWSKNAGIEPVGNCMI